jgi:hypothetical protein
VLVVEGGERVPGLDGGGVLSVLGCLVLLTCHLRLLPENLIRGEER